MKKALFFFSLLIVFFPLSSENETEGLDSLFEKYKQNDVSFQKALLAKRQAELDYEKTCINNGIEFSVGSGSMNAEFAEDYTRFSISPEAEVKVPDWNNLSAALSFPYSFLKGSSSNPTDSKKKINDAGILLSADIISSKNKSKKLVIEKAERDVKKAKRELAGEEITLKNAFLKDLRDLYSSSLSVLQAENDLVDEEIDFYLIKVQGYASTSAKYRTTKLSVESAERNVASKKREYQSKLNLFASKCSVSAEELDADFDIPLEKLLSIKDFDEEKFKEIENASWNSYVNSFERENDSGTSLSAQAGYGFSYDEKADGTKKTQNVLKTGLTWNWKGVSISGLFKIPLDKNSNPSVSLSVAWNPFESKKTRIDDEVKSLESEMDKLNERSAREKFKSVMLEKEETESSLEWDLNQKEEELEMYRQLESDMKSLYNRGYISESEYRQAKINYENAKVKYILSKLDRLIYNNEVLSLFNAEAD